MCDMNSSALSFTHPPTLHSCHFPADTKRKVEQISEELRTLDEMLAGNGGTDGAADVTDADVTSSAPHDDQDQMDRKGNFLHRN